MVNMPERLIPWRIVISSLFTCLISLPNVTDKLWTLHRSLDYISLFDMEYSLYVLEL